MSLSALTTCGVCTSQTWPYYLAICAAGAHMFNQVSYTSLYYLRIFFKKLSFNLCYICKQVRTLDIYNPKDCADKFVSNNHVGWIMFLGIALSTLLKSSESDESETTNLISN